MTNHQDQTTADRYEALVVAIGRGFHPDTRGADYVSLPEGYTPELVDEIVEAALADPQIEDAYEFALEALTCPACRQVGCIGECLY